MRVLIACEFSGVVREAFRALGHDAWSCDLLPAEDGSASHYQADASLVVRDRGPWDLLIAHPPCTFLANSGVRWLYGGRGRTPDPDRWAAMRAGAAFFATLYHAPVPRVAIENPVMHGHGRAAAAVPDATQFIQPWQFGHGEKKATGLWLRNLPPLRPTRIVPPAERVARVHRMSPGPNRWKERSRTLPGIAAAMAAQWGALDAAQHYGDSQSTFAF